MTELHLRALTAEERGAAFANGKPSSFDIESYKAAVKRMQVGVGYAIAINGATPRATRVRFTKAAKLAGRRLHWAKYPPDAKEMMVELAP